METNTTTKENEITDIYTCTCNVEESRIKIDYANCKINAPWDELCDYCAHGLEEALAHEGQRQAEAVSSAIQSGLSASDAKLYVAQERPVEDLGPSNEASIAYWENATPDETTQRFDR